MTIHAGGPTNAWQKVIWSNVPMDKHGESAIIVWKWFHELMGTTGLTGFLLLREEGKKKR